MSISADEAAKVASLARLDLPKDRIGRIVSQFNDILGYVQKLNEADTTGVEPLYSPVTHSTVFREDVVQSDFNRDALLANAPESDGRFFIVPRIVG